MVTAALTIVDDPDGRDQQRGRDGMPLTVRAKVFVVERVLAGDEGRADRTAPHHDSRARLPPAHPASPGERVAPAEIIQDGDPLGVCADGDGVADGFIDHAAGHAVGIALAIFRIDAVAESTMRLVPRVPIGLRTQRIGRAVVLHARSAV